MDDSNAKRQPRHPHRRFRWYTDTIGNLRKWVSDQGRGVPGEFLRGAAYKLGSGAVTVLILWWETHR
ncbi:MULTISPECIES: hypothetical protein [unclassified Streptomyces]|uniref:hypothetical protein n=1 Tax=unclassified Streptomyces TaxID=2593676 RepID=UPI0036F6CBEA